MKVVFKKTDKLYNELSPRERICQIISEKVYPQLETHNFKFLKSGPSMKRAIGPFIQEIWFSLNRRNHGDEICAFTPHFSVAIKNYNRWFKSQYGFDSTNDVLIGHAANYISGWDSKLFTGNDYDFAEDSNSQIVELLIDNISGPGIAFFESFSDYPSAIEYIKKQERYYLAPKMIDICIMNDDISLASEVYQWFRSYEETEQSDFMESTLSDMNLRKNRITEHNNS